VITLTIKPNAFTTKTQYFNFVPPATSSYSVNVAPTVTGTVTSATITWSVNHGSLAAYQTTAPITISP
jgi:hypothetical protein